MRPLLLLLLLAPPALAQKEFGFDNRRASGQPYRTPQQTVAGLTVPPEFEVKLFAGEPDVVNPVAFSIDERGRVWVLECFEYPSKTPKGKAPRDRIVILEDTDGDGTADKRTVFAEGKDFPVTPERAKAGLPAFDLATGLEVGHGAVWVGAPPYLWRVEIKDDKPGKFEPVLGGFGSQDTHETLNTFQWGPDGWLYGMQGVFTQSTVKPQDGPETRMNAAVWRFHPTARKFEIFAEGTSNPWGLDWRTTDGQFILACCVIPHLYHVVPGGIYKRQAGSSYNPHAYEHIQEISDHTFHRESGWAHAGLLSLDVPHMPERFRQSVIFGSIHGCSLKQNVLRPHGSSYTASRGDDFLSSADKNVRPINLRWGPHGDIYLIDWHDQNPCHQAPADAWDYARGRVYRIQLKGRAAQPLPDFGKRTRQEVAEAAVFATDPWTRRTALRLVSESTADVNVRIAGPGRFLPLAQALAGPAKQADERALGVWLGVILAGAKDVPHGRAFVYRAAAQLAGGVPGLAGRLADAAAVEGSPVVRRELASAAVRLADAHDVSALVHALMQRKEDAADPLIPHLTWLAYEKVVSKKTGADTPVEKELAWLGANAAGNPFVADRIVPKVMRRLVAAGQPADLELCLKFVADATDAGVRSKALGGLAAALGDKQVPAPSNWPALRDALAADSTLSPHLDALAVSFRDPTAASKAEVVLTDRSRSTSDRAEAVRRLVRLRGANSKPTLLGVTLTDADPVVRVEAARQLARVPASDVAPAVLTKWNELPPPVRAELVTTLAGRKEWARALLNAVKAGSVGRAELTDTHVTRMQAFKDKELDALVAAAWGRTRATPADLEALINRMRGELASGPGSLAKGKAVFAAQCGKCHQFDGAGANVGPALDGAGRDIEYILANVLDPNRVVGAPYFQRIATLQDGRVEQGVLHDEDDQSVTLKAENGVFKRLAKGDLDGPVRVVEKSLMPEGIAAGMTAQDFRDLTAYLMASPFPAAVSVDGKPVAVPVSGLIPLPAPTGKPVTVTLKVTAASPLSTKLTVGSADAYTVAVDGTPVGEGRGLGRRPGPDTDSFPVTLAPGEHTVTLTVKWQGATPGVFLRLLDPDRKLTAGR